MIDFEDSVRGCIYGGAIGDILGFGAEFMTKHDIKILYPRGLKTFNQSIRPKTNKTFHVGEWSDDTSHGLELIDSIIENESVNINDIARRLYNWALNDCRGIGSTVYDVISKVYFCSDPHKASKEVWELRERKNAANGAIMRTAILGVWQFDDIDAIKNNVEMVTRITHFDQRCVDSCFVICNIISNMLKNKKNGLSNFANTYNIHIPLTGDVAKYYDLGRNANLSNLKLDELSNAGYTCKTMGAAIWALKNATSFEDGIIKIVNEGGDTDTNASVAGSLLGVKFGFSSIPEIYTKNIYNLDRLECSTSNFIKLMKSKI